MSDRASAIRRILAEYENVRIDNQRQGQRRELEVRQKSEVLAGLLDERRTIFSMAARAAFGGRCFDQDELKARFEDINGRIRARLVEESFAEDYLQPIYRCAVCRDTGYVGEPIHELCKCVRQRLMDDANASERRGGLGSHSFEQFDLNIFPDDLVKGQRRSQREHMRLIRRAAERYADDFPDNEKPNLIFFGAPGLGKTFVADCIASRVMDRAYLVRRVTAYRMCEIMRKNQYDGSEAQAVEDIMGCDLLLIDDLGTEPQTKNTSGYIFQIINERNNNDLHTIISTNMKLEKLPDVYDERVASRLCDASRTTAIEFYGRDLRLIRK